MGLHLADQGLEPGHQRRDPGLQLGIGGAPGGIQHVHRADPPFQAAGGRGLTDLPVGGPWRLGRSWRPCGGAVLGHVRARRYRSIVVGLVREEIVCEDL